MLLHSPPFLSGEVWVTKIDGNFEQGSGLGIAEALMVYAVRGAGVARTDRNRGPDSRSAIYTNT